MTMVSITTPIRVPMTRTTISDADTVCGDVDNCEETPNTDQSNLDGDLRGDACDDDRDGDEVPNSLDHYPDDSTKSLNRDRVRSERRCSKALERAGDRARSCRFANARSALGSGLPADYSSCDDRLDQHIERAEGRYAFCPDSSGLAADVASSVESSLEAAGAMPGGSGDADPACSSRLARVTDKHASCHRRTARKHRAGRNVVSRQARCDSRLQNSLDRIAQRMGDSCVQAIDVQHLIESHRGTPSVSLQSDPGQSEPAPPVSVLDLPELIVPDPNEGSNPDICACISTTPDSGIVVPEGEAQLPGGESSSEVGEVLLPDLEITSGEAQLPDLEIIVSGNLEISSGQARLEVVTEPLLELSAPGSIDIREGLEAAGLVIFESAAEATAAGLSTP